MIFLFTFHTNFDANVAVRKLKGMGTVTMKPVPRTLSSSCGTAVLFQSDDSTFQTSALLNLTFEKLYQVEDQSYTMIFEQN